MSRKSDLVARLSEIVAADPPYRVANIGFTVEDLEGFLPQLSDYEPPTTLKIQGERPPKPRGGISEGVSKYREQLCDYIKLNTSVEVPVCSTVPERVYDDITEYLGL